MNIAIAIKRSHGYAFLPLAIVLTLSAFTHLWNPIGFPTQHGDEAHYMRRAMHVLDGLGPQERVSSDRPYDHPYFGQIFLAAILGSTGYPDSFHPRADLHSIELLYLVPRILMGLLGIVDTLLVYKIAERRYNKNIALIAALLFAGMPLTWFVRRILLDSILLPFLLLSILFATTSNNKINNTHDAAVRELAYFAKDKHNEKRNHNKINFLVILISGIFLGLAIFTKIPSICIAPLIGCMIFTSNVRKWRSLGIWVIPVILIPLIWPSYSLLTDKFPSWMNDVFWQGGREGSGIWSLYSILKMDPVLTSLGIAGLVFAIIKRDFLPILWMIPFMIFIEFIGFTQNFYWIILLPAFCIAGAVLIASVLRKISRSAIRKGGQKSLEEYGAGNLSPRQKYDVFNRAYAFFREYTSGLSSYKILYVVSLVGLSIFGLASTTMIIKPFLNSTHFELYAFIVQNLPEYDDALGAGSDANNKVTVIGDRRWLAEFLWVPEYVFGKDLQFRGNFRTIPLSLNEPIETKKVLLIVDSRLMDDISSNSDEKHIRQLKAIYNSSKTIGTFEDSEEYKIVRSQRETYPFTNMEDNRGTGEIEIRVNY